MFKGVTKQGNNLISNFFYPLKKFMQGNILHYSYKKRLLWENISSTLNSF